jgi:hypothetical protein
MQAVNSTTADYGTETSLFSIGFTIELMRSYAGVKKKDQSGRERERQRMSSGCGRRPVYGHTVRLSMISDMLCTYKVPRVEASQLHSRLGNIVVREVRNEKYRYMWI